MWQPLLANLAVVAIAIVAWCSMGHVVVRQGAKSERLLFGGILAAGTVGSMVLSYEAAPGVFYDLRGPLLAVAGFFGGPIAALITTTASGAFRISMGGAVLSGMIGIGLCTAVGLVGYSMRRSRRIEVRDLLGLAIAVSVTSLLIVVFVPAEARATVLPMIWVPVVIAFVGTLTLGFVLLQEARTRELTLAYQLYRSMADVLPDCLNVKDVDGRFLAANPATAKLMGASTAQELVGRTDFDFYEPDLAVRFREDEAAVLSKGYHATIEQTYRRTDGSVGWLSTMKALIKDDAGQVLGIITHNRDITAAKLLQNKLETTKAELDQALENMSDGLAMYDRQGFFLFCNRRYQELFPRTAHLRVPGANFADIIRASIHFGEEKLLGGQDVEAHVVAKLAGLREDGDRLVELSDGRWLSSRTKVVADGRTLMVVSDITERRTFEKDLEHQALHDSLTGLPNRAFFNRELKRLMDQSRSTDSELVVMILDLDRFKEVNDTLGHAAGDALLVEVSRRLERAVRRGDFVARLGGDEFAILMPCETGGTGDVSLASRIMKALTKPVKIGDVTLLPCGTLGYTVYPKDKSDSDGLMKHADLALYQAKSRRRGTWKSYDPNCVPAAPAAIKA